MCNSAAIYQLRFLTASVHRFCLIKACLLKSRHDIQGIFFLLKTKNTFWTIFWSSFLMCDSAAIYQLRFATASERRFCLAVVAKPCKIIAQQSRSWIFTLQFFEVKLRWFLTPSSANSAQLYSFCFPPLKQWGQSIYKILFIWGRKISK